MNPRDIEKIDRAIGEARTGGLVFRLKMRHVVEADLYTRLGNECGSPQSDA